MSRRLYILYWRELSRRRLLPAVSPTAGHLTTPTVAGLPGLCENFRPTTSKSSPILHLLSSHWATSVVRTRVIGVANVGDSLRRLCSLQHRIYNLLGLCTYRRRLAQGNGGDCTTTKTPHRAPPPCEEMDPATISTDAHAVRYQACFCAQEINLFLGKSSKTAATGAALFDSNVHQIVCRLGLHPQTPLGVLTAIPQTP